MDWDAIRKEFETTNVTMKALADKHGVKDATIRSRKNREGWQRNATQQNKNVATEKKRKEQKNRSGNPNPVHKFPKHNSFQRKHGLYSKYLSDTQREIIEDFEGTSIADQLWVQIEIKFSAIIQMQKVMWVEYPEDTLSAISMSSDGDQGSMTGYKVSFAYEQYETYIKAQARAMAEYRNLVKQFLEMAHEADERKLKLEQMRLNIEKTKAEIDNMNDDEEDKPIEIMITRKSDRT